MRILCVIDNLGPGGAQRQLVELAIGFKDRGHEVVFLTYYKLLFFNDLLKKKEIPVHTIQTANYLKRIIRIRQHIRSGNYDAILPFLEGPSFMCELASFPTKSWKLIVGERSANRKIHKTLLGILYRWFHFRADYIVANSSSNLKLVRKANPFLPHKKYKVIHNMIDFNHWKPSPEYVPRESKKLRLIIVASHLYIKNLKGVVTALSELIDNEKADISIEWFGDRLEEPFYDNSYLEASQLIRKLGLENIISFHPATFNIAQEVQKADAVGLFSFVEGLPNALCEGMACAKTIISSAISDMPEMLSHSKRLLCDPLNPDSIRESISYLLKLGKKDLVNIGMANEKIARDLFNRESILSKYLELLEK